jgi:hypothetical protein
LGDAPARSGGEREARSRRHPPRRHNYRHCHANRDLLGSTSTELPTLDGCGQYRKLVWFYFRAGGADTTTAFSHAPPTITAHRSARAGKNSPTGTLPGDSANSWGRIEIPATGDGYYDQYRIEVSVASGTVVLTSKIVGVR